MSIATYSISLLVLLTLSVSLCQAGCPYTFKLHGDYCYRIFSKVRASWFEAKTYCNVAGGDLATIESKEEELYIESELRKEHGNVSAGTPENYWLDGSDILTEGEWRWMSEEGESRLITGYTRWAPGQPDNAGTQEHCLEIRYTFGVLWNDYQCQVQQNFICKSSNGFETGVIG
ncbi:perlucin-like [Mytilus edulis]|uniref:perlucin-like n=1 Tax=Mytilus edulis TaxID=6550 RepID=UPI0039F02154